LAGPRPASVPGPRATPPAHGVFFPTGTVIAADRAHNRSFSVLWRGSPYRTELSKGPRRQYTWSRAGPPCEPTSYVANGPAQVPYRWEIARIILENTRKNTVLDGNLPRDHGRPYRTGGEGLPSLRGKNSVPVGKLHRTRGELSPFSTERITVLVGKDYRTSREVH
jgi:hypothetical protein